MPYPAAMHVLCTPILGRSLGSQPLLYRRLQVRQHCEGPLDYVQGTLVPALNTKLEAARDHILSALDGFYGDGRPTATRYR